MIIVRGKARAKAKWYHIFHSWATVWDTGKYHYQRCFQCRMRRIKEMVPNIPQPVDVLWVDREGFRLHPALFNPEGIKNGIPSSGRLVWGGNNDDPAAEPIPLGFKIYIDDGLATVSCETCRGVVAIFKPHYIRERTEFTCKLCGDSVAVKPSVEIDERSA